MLEAGVSAALRMLRDASASFGNLRYAAAPAPPRQHSRDSLPCGARGGIRHLHHLTHTTQHNRGNRCVYRLFAVTSNVMAEEKLIILVRLHECLYNIKSRHYSDQHMKHNAWEQIAKELNKTRK